MRSALIAEGLALPARWIIVNPTPADLPKERQPLRSADRTRRDRRNLAGALHGFTLLREFGLDGWIVAGVGR